MEQSEAIEILKAYRIGGYATLMDIRVMFNAIDTVLAELEKQKQVKAACFDECENWRKRK